MHTRREIDHILDEINDIIAKNKESNKEDEDSKALLKHLTDTINLKTNNGKRAKGMWTDSPEFNCTNIFNK
tara:strand:+ start:1224 stop:1436 length:213 start_codon:yes stop_codon:yes gene_type:complete